MSDDNGRRYRHHRTPPRGYPVPEHPEATRSDGMPITFVDEISAVHDAVQKQVPSETLGTIVDVVESSLRKYHIAVEPSRTELASLHQMQARLHALVETMALPMLKDVLGRANRIEDLQTTAAAKLDMFIKLEFEPVKKEAAKIPTLQRELETLGDDLAELRKSFADSEAVRASHVREIKALQDRDDLQARSAQRIADMREGEKRLAKRLIWLASGCAGVVGFVAQRWGADVIKLLKGLL